MKLIRALLTTAAAVALLLPATALPVSAQPDLASPDLAEKHFEVAYRVTVTNLTRAQIISPPLVVSHTRAIALFEPGGQASDALALLAEDGDASALADELTGLPQVLDVAVAPEFLMPGASTTLVVDTGFPFVRISAAGMLVTTNDAFFGLNSVNRSPRFTIGVHYPDTWDAGTELNSEDCAFIPGPPCGNLGARDTENAEGYIYIHNGIHGIGDVAAESYDWRNPAVRVEIQRVPPGDG